MITSLMNVMRFSVYLLLWAIIRAVCLNEALAMDIETDRMHDIIAVAIQNINFSPFDRYVPFLHDCYKFSDRFGRVVRELFVSCRKSGKKMFLTNITMIVRGLLLVIHKYINSY